MSSATLYAQHQCLVRPLQAHARDRFDAQQPDVAMRELRRSRVITDVVTDASTIEPTYESYVASKSVGMASAALTSLSTLAVTQHITHRNELTCIVVATFAGLTVGFLVGGAAHGIQACMDSRPTAIRNRPLPAKQARLRTRARNGYGFGLVSMCSAGSAATLRVIPAMVTLMGGSASQPAVSDPNAGAAANAAANYAATSSLKAEALAVFGVGSALMLSSFAVGFFLAYNSTKAAQKLQTTSRPQTTSHSDQWV